MVIQPNSGVIIQSDSFVPKIEFGKSKEIVFSPTEDYQYQYQTTLSLDYDITAKHSTKVTIRNKSFDINQEAFSYLNNSLQHGDFNVSITETFFDVDTHENNIVNIDVLLDNFWMLKYYHFYGANINLGVLYLQVEVYDRITEKSILQELQVNVRWFYELS